MSEEINLSSIIDRIIQKKSILTGIIAVSFILSVIYALNKDETYKAQAYLIPPESRYTQPLNVFLDDGYRLSREEITPTTSVLDSVEEKSEDTPTIPDNN